MAENTLSTHAYFDPTEQTLTFITPKNVTLRTIPVPQDVLDSPRNRQETWTRTQVRKTGAKPAGRAVDYPWGFYYSVA
jgi:hypothetical protein